MVVKNVGLVVFLLLILALFVKPVVEGFYYLAPFDPVRGRYGDYYGLNIDKSGTTAKQTGGQAWLDPQYIPLGPAGRPSVRMIYDGYGGPGPYDAWSPRAAGVPVNGGVGLGSGSGWGPNSWVGTSSYGHGPYRAPYLRNRLRYWRRIYRRPLWFWTPYRRPFYRVPYGSRY